MRDRTAEGLDFLASKREGLDKDLVQEALTKGGVVHMAADCLLLGYPCEDAPRTLWVSFQCSHLGALYRVLCSLRGSFDRVRWVRGFRGDMRVRERAIEDFGRKLTLGDAVSAY